MSRDLDLEFAQAYKRTAEQRFPGAVQQVRIFGSRARGDFRDDSDLDLFVEIRNSDEHARGELQSMAWDVAYGMVLPYMPTPHVMTHDHFERLKQLETRLARDILEEGIPV